MSAEARGHLSMVASLWSGARLFSIERLPEGGYEMRYRAGFCARPGASPEEVAALRERVAERIAAETELVVPYADRDRSGSVSEEEAASFRELVIFGLQVTKLQPADRESPEAVAKALGQPVAWVMERAAAYRELRDRVLGSDPDPSESRMPPLPF